MIISGPASLLALEEPPGPPLSSALESFRASQAQADLLVPRIREFGTQGHVYASQLLAAAGRLEEAVGEARSAVEKDPNAGEGHHLLGRLLVQAGDTIGAAEELGRIRALASTSISPPQRFWEAALQAEIHLASGETGAAGAELDRIGAMKLAHRDPPAEQRLRARVARAEGRDAEARKAWEAFLALPDSMPGASVVEKTLAILEVARIEESAGEVGSARARYREIVDRWGKADMPLEGVAEARSRLSALETR